MERKEGRKKEGPGEGREVGDEKGKEARDRVTEGGQKKRKEDTTFRQRDSE